MTNTMKKLTITSIKMENIKGIKEFEFTFGPKVLLQYPNGFGKSTILDTIMWLLTGQTDLHNRKFEPVSFNQAMAVQPQWAELRITLDSIPHTLKMGRENGNASLEYYIDGRKKSKSGYTDELADMGLSDLLVAMNPQHMLSYLTWQEARAELSKFIAAPSRPELEAMLMAEVGSLENPVYLSNTIAKATSFDWNAETIKAEIGRRKGQLEAYITMIGAEQAKLASFADVDTTQLKLIKEDLLAQRNAILAENNSAAITAEIEKLNEERAQLNKFLNDVNVKRMEILRNDDEIALTLNKLQKKAQQFKDEGNKLAITQFSETCSFCGQALDATHLEKMHAYKNEQVSKIYADYRAAEAEYNAFTVSSGAKLAENKSNIEKLKTAETGANARLHAVSGELTTLNTKLRESMINADVIKIDERLVEINKQLGSNADSIRETIKSFEAQKDIIDDELSEYEFISRLAKTRLSIIAKSTTDKIAAYFPGLTIELEKTLKNGKVEPQFTISMNGVPYKDLNTAHRFISGMIFARGMQKLIGIQAPLLLDNFEGLDSENINKLDLDAEISFIGMAVK